MFRKSGLMCECYAKFLRSEFARLFNARFGFQSHSHDLVPRKNPMLGRRGERALAGIGHETNCCRVTVLPGPEIRMFSAASSRAKTGIAGSHMDDHHLGIAA